MFKRVEIKLTDTCLTYVLRRLGFWDSFSGLDGFEFVGKFKLVEIFDYSSLEKGDIIVLKRKSGYFQKKNTIIDENGICFLNRLDLSYHFWLFEGNFISEYGQSGITTFDTNLINIKKSSYTFFKISYSEIENHVKNGNKKEESNKV